MGNLKNENMNKNVEVRLAYVHGVTLIALVFTIVILIILAVVAINLGLGDNGLLKKAQYAKESYLNEQAREEEDITELYSQLLIATDGTVNLNLEKLEQIILDKTYPVGSVYITTDDKNPGETLGGEWEEYAKGRTIVGVGTENDGTEEKIFEVGETGGEYSHILTESELPNVSGTISGSSVNPLPATGGVRNF